MKQILPALCFTIGAILCFVAAELLYGATTTAQSVWYLFGLFVAAAGTHRLVVACGVPAREAQRGTYLLSVLSATFIAFEIWTGWKGGTKHPRPVHRAEHAPHLLFPLAIAGQAFAWSIWENRIAGNSPPRSERNASNRKG